MEFCSKCGMRLILEPKPSNDDGHFVFLCPKCGDITSKLQENPLMSKLTHRFRDDVAKEQERITVVSEEQAKIRTMPTTRIDCPKCSNREAYWWMVQTRSADEASTQFLRCTKCNYTWREID